MNEEDTSDRLMFICYEGHPFWVEGYEDEIPNCPTCGDRTMRNSRIQPSDIPTVNIKTNSQEGENHG